MLHPPDEFRAELMAQEGLFALEPEIRERIRGARVLYVLVTHNSRRWMAQFIDGILAQEDFRPTLAVIDNASSDDTLDLLESYRTRLELIIIRNAVNEGYALAVNAGLRHFLANSYDYCFLLNADVALRPNCVAELAAIAEENPGLGPLTPVHCSTDGYSPEPTFLWFLKLNPDFPAATAPRMGFKRFYTTPFITGAMMFFTRDLVEQAGLFDELFFFYGEDNDFCRRCRGIGRPPAVALRAQACHWHASNHGLDAFRRSHLRRSHYLMIMKHPGRPFLINLAGVFLKYCLDLGANLRSPGQFGAITRDLAACLAKTVQAVKARRRDRLAMIAAKAPGPP